MPRYLDAITKAKYELIMEETFQGKSLKEACQKYQIKSSSYRNWLAKVKGPKDLEYVESKQVTAQTAESHLPIILPRGAT